MEEQKFALMIRQALTEYDFERIDVEQNAAVVSLKREVYSDRDKEDFLTYSFTDPVLINVLKDLKSYVPAL